MNVLGLFSGIGGFELGLSRAGFEISALCEIELHCLSVLKKNFPNAYFFDDIKNVDGGNYDVICGGFPCQDISIAGKNAGLVSGEKSSLWFEFKRVIKSVQPKYAIIENVSALLGRGLEIILQDLAEIGYDATYTMYDSKYFGVPQRRRRVYIVAVRDGIPEESEIFDFRGRNNSSSAHKQAIASVESGFTWDFTQGEGKRDRFAFFTRQRSDQFNAVGLSSTLAKRDYKSFTDLIVTEQVVRRVSPVERLLLQGFPYDWWDGCGLTEAQKYTCNGMTVPVVEHIGGLVMEFDKNV